MLKETEGKRQRDTCVLWKKSGSQFMTIIANLPYWVQENKNEHHPRLATFPQRGNGSNSGFLCSSQPLIKMESVLDLEQSWWEKRHIEGRRECKSRRTRTSAVSLYFLHTTGKLHGISKGHLNRTCTRTIPADMTTWMGEVSQITSLDEELKLMAAEKRISFLQG